MTYQQRISITTKGPMHDLTDQVVEVIAASQVRTGMAHISNVGSTASNREWQSRAWDVTANFHLECDVRGRNCEIIVTVVGD